MVGSSTSVVQAANEYFDALVKSRFIEMFGDESFESKQLFDLFKTSSGGTPLKSKKQYYDGGTIPWLTSGEVDRLHINSARSKITQIALKETSAKIPPIGSVLVSMYGSVGYAGILEFEAAINQAICAIHPNPDFSPEWLCYYVRSKKEELTNQAVGAALNNISQDKIRKLMVPCPPIELQNEFTKFVRQVDKSKLLFQQVVSKYDELVKSRFIEMFESYYSDVSKLIDYDMMCSIITDGEHQTPKRSESGFYLLSARNIRDHFLSLDEVDYIDEEEFNRISKRIVPREGDVLISCSGTVGRVCTIPSGMRCQMVRSVAILRLKDGFNSTFVEWLISSPFTQNQISIAIHQSAQANLFQGKIKKLKGIQPPIELQNQFADFVRQVDKSKSEILEGIKRLKTNRITEQ